ncbi:hypothetical protein H5410_005755 [Solanum commersonii]|uniref:Reverse transcriptase domain-containing protein n=1 Tax=Solanum commersonii TaxID=4109 RepID=A0A9J6A7Q1_SOLCO|nr:hypothetical protein H5410_005755 [Solanum commersonii]
MSGLNPKVAVHQLANEVNKLIEAGFIREVKYPTWISSIVHVRKKNGQIRVCVDFKDLNNACPKGEENITQDEPIDPMNIDDRDLPNYDSPSTSDSDDLPNA